MEDFDQILTEALETGRLDEGALQNFVRNLSNPGKRAETIRRNMLASLWRFTRSPNSTGQTFMRIGNTLGRLARDMYAAGGQHIPGIDAQKQEMKYDRVIELAKEATKIEKAYWAWRQQVDKQYGREPDGINDLVYFLEKKAGKSREAIMQMPFAEEVNDVPTTVGAILDDSEKAIGLRIEKYHMNFILFDYIVDMMDSVKDAAEELHQNSNQQDDNTEWAGAQPATESVVVRKHKIVQRG